MLEFEELETGRVMQVDADQVRRGYRETVAGTCATCHRAERNFTIDAVFAATLVWCKYSTEAWNPGHPADFDGDGFVGITDFLELLANWGPCA